MVALCWLLLVAGCQRNENEVVAVPKSTRSRVAEPPPTSVAEPPIASEVSADDAGDVRVPPSNEAPFFLTRTDEALLREDIQAAGQAIRQAVSLQPDNPQIVFTMALVLAREHRFPEAVRMLDRLSQKVPETRLPGLGQTAEWLVVQGKWKEAESRFRSVLKEAPDAAIAHRQLAQLLLREGRRLEAARSLLALCRLGNVEEIELRALLSHVDPFAADLARESLEPIGPLGQARQAISDREWDRAANLLLASDPRTTEESALLGRVYAGRGDIAFLESWANEYPGADLPVQDAWFARGVLAANQSDHELAVQHFCRAVVLDPADEQAYERMALSLTSLGRLAQAEQARQRALWLAETREIGNQMATSDRRDIAQIKRLGDLLDQLRRPFESLSWQAVGIAYRRSELTADQQQAQLSDINRRRVRRIDTVQTSLDEDFLCCGVKLATIDPTIPITTESIQSGKE